MLNICNKYIIFYTKNDMHYSANKFYMISIRVEYVAVIFKTPLQNSLYDKMTSLLEKLLLEKIVQHLNNEDCTLGSQTCIYAYALIGKYIRNSFFQNSIFILQH